MDSGTITEQGEDLYLMSNVQPNESGLPFVVYISEKQGRHDVRVKVGKPPNFTASVSVRPDIKVVAGKLSERELALVRQWIELNRDVIIAHWEGKMASSRDVLNALKPIPKS
jgi:hypothetical protein